MKNMVSNTGKAFENKFRNWHKGLNCMTFKFPDYASTGTLQKAICDRVTITSSGVYWFECKHTESKTSFSVGLIKPYQWANMMYLEQLGQKPFFVIEDGNHNVYMLSPTMLWWTTKKKKSIKFKEIRKFVINKKKFIETFI